MRITISSSSDGYYPYTVLDSFLFFSQSMLVGYLVSTYFSDKYWIPTPHQGWDNNGLKVGQIITNSPLEKDWQIIGVVQLTWRLPPHQILWWWAVLAITSIDGNVAAHEISAKLGTAATRSPYIESGSDEEKNWTTQWHWIRLSSSSYFGGSGTQVFSW